jgi:hypothetical protein
METKNNQFNLNINTTMKSFEDLKTLLASLEDDAKKTEKGNDAASVRLRSGMMEVKKLASSIREEAMELRKK